MLNNYYIMCFRKKKNINPGGRNKIREATMITDSTDVDNLNFY